MIWHADLRVACRFEVAGVEELARALLYLVVGGANPLLDGNSGRPQPTCTLQGLESSSDLTKS